MMFIRTPVFFDADDGAGSGGPLAPGADPSLGTPSPDEQTFGDAKEFSEARRSLLREPPVVLHEDSPAPTEPAAPAATDEDALLAEIAGTPPPATEPTTTPGEFRVG